jgi:hypothetical protein
MPKKSGDLLEITFSFGGKVGRESDFEGAVKP